VIDLKYIFLDESGDLGFKPKSSKYFVVAALCTETEKTTTRCIKNVRTGLSKKYTRAELKFTESSDVTRRRVLECISKREVSVSYITLNKEWVKPKSRGNLPLIEKRMIARLLSEILTPSHSPVTITIDKYLPYKDIESFNSYLDLKMPCKVKKITHESSRENNGIQSVDFVAGAIHRKYREKDETFYDIISDKIDVKIDSYSKIFKKS
jgi:hypothetical protein